MMLTTHSLVGAALAVPVAVVAPELAPLVLVAGFVGGAFPDLDVVARHRRSLHYPRYYTVAAVGAAGVAVVFTSPVTVAAAIFLAGAAAHSLSDILGGGAEPRPWERRTEHAVYDHYARRWLAPRRWVRYDGSPEDLALALVVAAPVAYVAHSSAGAFVYVVAAAVFVSVVYTAFRRAVSPAYERVNAVSLHETARKLGEDDDSGKTL